MFSQTTHVYAPTIRRIGRETTIDTEKNEIYTPPDPSYVSKKQAIKLSASSLRRVLNDLSKGVYGKYTLNYLRGKQGGTMLVVDVKDGTYIVCPARDWFPGFGDVRYILDIQAGFTQEGEEEEHKNVPWTIQSYKEGMEESLVIIDEGPTYTIVLGVGQEGLVKRYNLELQEKHY